MGLFSELKRRNVIRVGLAYVVAAWVLTQVMEIATDAFEAPPWVLKLIVTALVVGLFPVLMFSWAYEITPEGIKREAEIERSESITAHTG
ncbi:MAG: adenylyl cyclase, partial [Gammaproteobacteria bacterium]